MGKLFLLIFMACSFAVLSCSGNVRSKEQWHAHLQQQYHGQKAKFEALTRAFAAKHLTGMILSATGYGVYFQDKGQDYFARSSGGGNAGLASYEALQDLSSDELKELAQALRGIGGVSFRVINYHSEHGARALNIRTVQYDQVLTFITRWLLPAVSTIIFRKDMVVNWTPACIGIDISSEESPLITDHSSLIFTHH